MASVLKTDLQKAYSLVHHGFVEEILKGRKVSTSFIDWVIVCINGESHEFFKRERGLRQGDPCAL